MNQCHREHLYPKVAGVLCDKKYTKSELCNPTQSPTHILTNFPSVHGTNGQDRRACLPSRNVKLHQEYQIGVCGLNDSGSYLRPVDIMHGAVNNLTNLAESKLSAWTGPKPSAIWSENGLAERIYE